MSFLDFDSFHAHAYVTYVYMFVLKTYQSVQFSKANLKKSSDLVGHTIKQKQ